MNYPNGMKKNFQRQVDYSNRGMSLESEINLSNEYYRDSGIAYIYKKPTPIRVVKMSYLAKDKVVIKEAFFERPSTTDYNGLYRGKYIDFEAKETNNKRFFPLANIHKHQLEHIRNINNNGGICFLIVRFVKLNETYLLWARDLIDYLDQNKNCSIKHEYFESKGCLIANKYCPRVDYIEIIDKYLEVFNR